MWKEEIRNVSQGRHLITREKIYLKLQEEIMGEAARKMTHTKTLENHTKTLEEAEPKHSGPEKEKRRRGTEVRTKTKPRYVCTGASSLMSQQQKTRSTGKTYSKIDNGHTHIHTRTQVLTSFHISRRRASGASCST